jgi:hypothetical protein
MDIHVRMAYWKSSVSNNYLIFFIHHPSLLLLQHNYCADDHTGNRA